MAYNELFSLDDKTALITGGSRGIGFAIAIEMAKSGANIIICSENNNELLDAKNIAFEQGYKFETILCDLTDFNEQKQMIENIISEFGKLDILICNAGITGSAGPFSNMTMDNFDKVININLRANVNLSKLTLPYIEKSQGSLIFISSISGLRGNLNINAYALSKAAIAQLCRNLAIEWGPKGVNINCISPGFIDTPLSKPLLENHEFMAKRLQMTPLRRVGEPNEIAGACVFLTSKAGGFIQGHNLVIDGGTIITDGN